MIKCCRNFEKKLICVDVEKEKKAAKKRNHLCIAALADGTYLAQRADGVPAPTRRTLEGCKLDNLLFSLKKIILSSFRGDASDQCEKATRNKKPCVLRHDNWLSIALALKTPTTNTDVNVQRRANCKKNLKPKYNFEEKPKK